MKVFISYSHKDTSFVEPFIHDLRSSGMKVWIDHKGIQAGDTWTGSILDAIAACDAFIVVLSPSAVASENVEKEILLAAEEKKAIYPVYCAQCEPSRNMRYPLAGKQHIDLSGYNYTVGMEKLVAALKGTQVSDASPSSRQPASSPNVAPAVVNVIGTWGVQYQHPMTGLGGYGQVVCMPNGQFQSRLMTAQGEIGAAGGWQFAGNQIALQGTYAFALNPFNVLPYSLVMVITNYQPALINFTAMSGELVVWQRL